ncbi:hypothetical protein [Halosimplex sp. TS25]|uniref:hypothetical protein n=1 Tax=Halosimplex rarum TaxID=3396619 RepID=UPI0039EC9AAD
MGSLLPEVGFDGTAVAAGAAGGLTSGCLGLLFLPTDSLSALGAASGAVVGGVASLAARIAW